MWLRRVIVLTKIKFQQKRLICTAENNVTYHMGLNRAENYTAHTAVIIDDKNRFSYRNLADRVASMVTLLRNIYGTERGDRVLCRVNKSFDSLALYLATMRLGAIYVALNPAYTLPETIYFVKDSDPHLFVSCNVKQDDLFSNKVEHVVDSETFFEESRQMKPSYDIEKVNADDVACICYTSGTTGLPKGAMISHGGLIWNANALIKAWQFTKDDVLLHFLPFYHVHGMFISLNCTLFTKSAVIFRPKFDVNDAIHWLPHCTVMMGVPTYYSRLMQNPNFDKNLTRNVRLFVCGSAPLQTSLWKEFKDRTGHKILERYGMTEAAVITTNPYDDRRQGSAGRILPDGHIRISKQGLVQICLPSLFLGYWKNVEKTREEFTDDGFFNTGDLGRIDNDGFLWLQGRAKDLIISGGLNIYAKEVEDAIDTLPNVRESAVIGVPHQDLGEAVLALCVMDPNCHTVMPETEVIFSLRGKLANYKLPKRIFFIEKLPRNSMGKVQKNILRSKFHNLFISE